MVRGTDQELTVCVSRPWVSVPLHILEDTRLSLSARALLCYILHLAARPNWTIRVAHVQRMLGLTQAAWQKLRRELQAAGYYAIKKEHGPKGRIEWSHRVSDLPAINPTPTIPRARAAQKVEPAELEVLRGIAADILTSEREGRPAHDRRAVIVVQLQRRRLPLHHIDRVIDLIAERQAQSIHE